MASSGYVRSAGDRSSAVLATLHSFKLRDGLRAAYSDEVQSDHVIETDLPLATASAKDGL